jgi:hypothetical protein
MSAEMQANRPVVYPESDGEPMADNTLQAEWMMTLQGNLDACLADFVGMNNFWYPREGHPEIRLAPDVYVACGRPKGHRSSYRQWEENDTPVTVIFEILSPGNTSSEMAGKFLFYEEHGVEEYYIHDPQANRLEVWLRRGSVLRRVLEVDGFVSPRLGIRFDLQSDPARLTVWRPDGQRFLTMVELDVERQAAREAQRLAEAQARSADADRQIAEAERDQARQQREAAEAARVSAEAEREAAEAARVLAEAARVSAEAERDRAQQQVARLRFLMQRLRQGLATPEELAELDRLHGGTA